METDAAAIGEPLPAAPRTSRGGSFFVGIAVTATAVVFLGFARTYYLKSVFPTPSFPMLFQVHGALFTAWMLLFVLQATLVAARRTSLHRRIGLIGRFLVVPMLVTGSLAAVAAARGQAPISAAVARGEFAMVLPRLSPLETMVIPLTTDWKFGQLSY